MTGYEEQLFTRAEVLEDTDELVQSITAVLAGAQGAGVDPRAVISLTAALQALDPGAAVSYSAGSQKDRRDGIRIRLRRRVPRGAVRCRGPGPGAPPRGEGTPGTGLPGPGPRAGGPRAGPPRPGRGQGRAGRGLRHAHQAAVRRLPQCPRRRDRRRRGRRSPTPRPGSRTRNAGSPSARPPPTSSTPSPNALARALARLRTVPQDLGEVYELIYEFVRSGGKLPRYGRWIEGART